MSHSALLVMDVQQGIVDRIADDGYVARLSGAIEAARVAGIPVVYVVVGFREGYPEVSLRNKSFGAIRDAGGNSFTSADPGSAVHPDIAPLPGDVVVTKKRVSAFAGSDLDLVLRAGGIDHLVLSGISTSGVVLSTLCQAADLDFGLTVLEDGCVDPSQEVHQVLTQQIFSKRADLVTIEEWVKSLAG
jgi:nicotinamidase-related amidase